MRETNKTLEWEQEILKEISNRYPEAKVELKSVVKLGGTKKAIVIMEKESNVCPTIYLENFEELQVSEACNEIQEMYEEHKATKNINMEWFYDFEKVKDKLHIKLINAENNKEYLKDKPFIQFLDLAAAFYARVNANEIGEGNIMILNNHAKMWNVTAEMLYEIAKENEHATITDMADFMAKYTETDNPKGVQYIISNTKKRNGAGAFIADIDKLKERFKKFYILPSSIHEVLLIPENRCQLSKTDLDDLVKNVNITVSPDERLADHAYYFNGEKLEA